MSNETGMKNTGVLAAMVSALLFGAGAPLAKMLLEVVGPWMLAGLFYLGAGLGLSGYRMAAKFPAVRLARGDAGWLAGAIGFGGVAGPALLMLGLASMPASGASLLLNAEGVFTAVLAWFMFRENFDRRIALGMVSIAAGALLLSWPEQADFAGMLPAIAILGACLCWGLDNNLTRKVSLTDATWIASVKGLCAGSVNLALAGVMGETLPPLFTVGAAMLVGFLAYGVSLTLFVVGLRHLGAARTGAYFCLAPFFGALLALVGGEPVTGKLLATGLLMGLGVGLHLTERHSHAHVHEPMEHTHAHAHDEHHQHTHPWAPGLAMRAGETHTHPHWHEALEHTHAHFPDAHHRHSH